MLQKANIVCLLVIFKVTSNIDRWRLLLSHNLLAPIRFWIVDWVGVSCQLLVVFTIFLSLLPPIPSPQSPIPNPYDRRAFKQHHSFLFQRVATTQPFSSKASATAFDCSSKMPLKIAQVLGLAIALICGTNSIIT